MYAKISPYRDTESVSEDTLKQEIKTLEYTLEYDCNIEVINNLIKFYTVAIENFESVLNPIYVTYKEKLKNLLKRPDVQHEIKKQHQPLEESPIRPRALTNQPKLRKRVELSSERMIEKTLEWQKSETRIASEKIKENLQRQTELFNNKVFSRKKLNERNEKLAAFERGVEEIMEETQQAKEKVTKEIREKYKENLEELKNMPQNDLIARILQEVHVKLDEEIAVSIEAIETSKKTQIQHLKSNLKLNSLSILK